MDGMLLIIILIILGLAAVFLIPYILTRRAIRQVVNTFRKQNATSPQTAQTLADLRLQQKGLLQKQMTTRDYKPTALHLLMEIKVILTTEEDKYYLSETALANSRFGKGNKTLNY